MPSELGRVLDKYRQQQAQQQQYLQRLYLAMIDQSKEELRAALKSDATDKKFMAAYVVGDRRLPWHNDLITLLADASDPVRQAARRGLIILSFLTLNPDEAKQIGAAVRNKHPVPLERLNAPVDFGPPPEAAKAAQKKAQEQWREWWAKPRATPKPITGISSIPAETRVETNPERLAATLLKAERPLRKELIARHRDDEGDYHTQTLALAIAESPSKSRTDLREALVARLARHNETELRRYLDDDLGETRRAAVLTLVQRGRTAHVERVIAMLLDPEPVVQQTAHEALCTWSGKNFGPTVSATEAERNDAIALWARWWAENKESR